MYAARSRKPTGFSSDRNTWPATASGPGTSGVAESAPLIICLLHGCAPDPPEQALPCRQVRRGAPGFFARPRRDKASRRRPARARGHRRRCRWDPGVFSALRRPLRAWGGAVAEPPVTFAALLRRLRTEARLTQEELAETSGVRPRSISDLERGVAVSPQRETIRRLADALGLAGPVRAQFEAVARGRAVPAATEAAWGGGAVAATRTLPRDVASFTGRQQELQELVEAAAAAGGVVGIHAIGGMAGVGKTAFAVHAAHRLGGRVPGGEIFPPLHR